MNAVIDNYMEAYRAIIGRCDGVRMIDGFYSRNWDSLVDAGISLRKPRRPRRLSLREAERQAGRPVVSVTDRPDGSRTYAFGDKADAKGEVNDWDIEYGATSPSSVRQ